MTIEELTGDMPLADITAALDDNRDGVADDEAWACVQNTAEERLINACGGSIPTQYETAAAYARKLFILESLYVRRGFSGEQGNPFAKRAANAEKRLVDLVSGSNRPDGGSGGEEITTPLAATPRTGLMA